MNEQTRFSLYTARNANLDVQNDPQLRCQDADPSRDVTDPPGMDRGDDDNDPLATRLQHNLKLAGMPTAAWRLRCNSIHTVLVTSCDAQWWLEEERL
jgi:hypothetical protein